MLLDWTRHLSDLKEKEEFEKTIRGSTVMAKRLTELVEEKERSIARSELSDDAFDSAGWAYRQAKLIGNKEMLSWFRNLLTLDQRTN